MSNRSLSTFEQEHLIQTVYDDGLEMMQSGITPWEIERDLRRRGIPPDVAIAVINKLREAQVEAQRNAARNKMLLGAFIFFVGLAFSVFTYSIAEDGGTYIVATGLIGGGIILFFRGLMNDMD